MPKSKRDRQVPLTKTKKKRGREVKETLIERVRGLVEAYNRLFVMSLENVRSCQLQAMRTEFRDSRLVLGKNKLVARALGLTVQDELSPNLHKLARLLKHQKALLFTNRDVESVLDFFKSFASSTYARSGFVAVNSVELAAGPCPQWQHSMENSLRKLGLPVKLVKGVINIERDHVVCRRGQRLKPEQCELLKLCKYEMAEFRAKPLAVWDKEKSTLTQLQEAGAGVNGVEGQSEGDCDGKVRLESTVLDDGQSYFVPRLLEDDLAGRPGDDEEGEEEDEDEEMNGLEED